MALRQLRSEGIEDRKDTDAGPGSLLENGGQRVGDAPGRRIIHLDRDRLLGGAQVGPEPGKGAVAIQRELDAVAGHDRRAGEQADGQRERGLADRHRRAIGAHAPDALHGGSPRDEQDPDGGHDEDDYGDHPEYDPDCHAFLTAARTYFVDAESALGDAVVQGAIRSRVNFPK